MATATPEPSPLSKRSFSLPIARSSPSSDPQIEVLYTLSSARIVDFTASNPQARPGSSNGVPSAEDEIGQLSWVSPRERTIAVGPLRIYRAPGSVAFLNCANALRPILPKSQVWCVDGDSKFVLQVRRPQYWRIEVANKSEEDKNKVDELKRVFGEILLFEKTPCPFQRDFVVELPEAPSTPVTKRPWKPVQGPRPQTPSGQDTAIEFGYGSPAFARRASSSSPLRQSLLSNSRRNSELDLGVRFTSDGTHSPLSNSTTPPNESEETTKAKEDSIGVPDYFHSVQDENNEAEQAIESIKHATKEKREDEGDNTVDVQVGRHEESVDSTGELLLEANAIGSSQEDDSDGSESTDKTPVARGRWSRDLSLLSTSQTTNLQSADTCEKSPSPPNLTIITTPEVQQASTSIVKSAASDNESLSSSVESWHSLSPTDSEPSSPAQSFTFVSDEVVVPKRNGTAQDDLHTVDQEPRTWDISATPAVELDHNELSIASEPQTPTLTHDSGRSDDDRSEIMTPPAASTGLRHRATTSSNSRRRQLSPLPAVVNLFSPTGRPRHLQTARHLPTAIIQKTYEILMSPPSHLFQLMINIASKIAAGEWRGIIMGHGEAVHWDLEDEIAGESWHEDDYGIQLKTKPAKVKTQANSWELD